MRIGHCLSFVPLLLFSAGCMTINHTPEEFELDEPWPIVRSSGPVAVRGGNAPEGRFTIDLPGPQMTVDLQEYTEALVQRVREALSGQGTAIESDAATIIEIEVVYANILLQMRANCVVDFTVRAGNGYVRGHQARAGSRKLQKACDAALSRAAFELLADEQIQRYLAGS